MHDIIKYPARAAVSESERHQLVISISMYFQCIFL